MVACRIILTLALYVLTTGGIVSPAAAQTTTSSAPLSVEDVLKLSQGGVSEELIITTIKKNGKPFDLSPDEILELKKSGLSDNVIRYLMDPALPYAPAPPPPAKATEPPASPPVKAEPAKQYPPDPHAAKAPPEPGLYYFPKDAPVKIDIKQLLGEQSGGGKLGKLLLSKGKVTAYLVGPASKVRVPEGTPIFYLRLPDKPIEEVLLVNLERRSDRRELDLGPPGPKPAMKSQALRQFDAVEVGQGLYRITPSQLSKGEYLFYLHSTAEPAKGNYGKGYDFGTGVTSEVKKQ